MEKYKLDWCFKQKKGIKIVDSNSNISLNYLKRAEDDLKEIEKQNPNWKIVISYYICYNSLYSVLIKYGIKSEIHSCSIELMDIFNSLKEYKNYLLNLKQKRVEVQYYLKNVDEIDLIEVKNFVEICKLELKDFNLERFNIIRKTLEDINGKN